MSQATVLVDGRPAQGHARGIGVYVQRLVPVMAAHPRTVNLVIALDRAAGPDPWPGWKGAPRAWGSGGDPIRWEQIALPRLARSVRADLLHCTANSSPWRVSVPYVVTVHDTIFLRPLRAIADRVYLRQILAHFYYRWTVGRGARRARAIITVSQKTGSDVARVFGLAPEKIHVVRSAVPYLGTGGSEGERQEVLGQLGVRRPYVLALGAIDRRKNTAALVQAFARVNADARLVLAGFERADQSRVPALIQRLGLRDRVRILGFLPEPQLLALFAEAAVFAYPSNDEGFGFPVLQAFSMGVPVVTSRGGAIPEVAGEAAAFVDPGDLEGLAQTLQTLLTHSGAARRLAMDGLRRAGEFSWDRTAAGTLRAYEDALRAGGAGRP